ncbi:hypothetical protein FO519_000202 [Halicephalobus sp. NKZ332]|nr:hypothetical protein FO519_000202 [Halicephalobus sp. NKZ332]
MGLPWLWRHMLNLKAENAKRRKAPALPKPLLREIGCFDEQRIITMIRDGHLWSLLIFVGIFLPSSAVIDGSVNEKDVVRQTVGQLLDYKNIPSKDPQPNRANTVATAYMQKLFQEFNENSFFKDRVTIRSIIPFAGILNDTEVLVFKLQSINKNENILRAELHFRQSSKHHSKKDNLVKTNLMVTAGYPSLQMEKLEFIKGNSKVWSIWNAKRITEKIVHSNFPDLYIKISRNNRPLEADSMINKNTPFLLIYTLPNSENEQKEINFGNLMNSKEIEGNRVKRSTNQYYGYSFDQGMENNMIKIEDQDSSNFNKFEAESEAHEFLKNGPMSLKTRKSKQRRRKNRRFHSSINDPMQGFGMEGKFEDEKEEKTDSNLKILLLGKESKSDKYRNKRCKREKFSINFRDIGWQDVVIQPSSFDAYYCAGSCDFPLSLEGSPSNHALIQSLVNTMGIYPGVPKVCCAPEKMDSLTLLFFDESGNVVLKNFPRMIVSSCSCL